MLAANNAGLEGEVITVRTYSVTFPEVGLVAMTRGMAGAGAGLLLAGKLDASQRRAVGWTLLAVGLATTLPLLLDILSGANKDRGASEAGAGRVANRITLTRA